MTVPFHGTATKRGTGESTAFEGAIPFPGSAQPLGAMGNYPPATPRLLIPSKLGADPNGWWRVSWSAKPLGINAWIEGDPGGYKVVDPHRYTDAGFRLFAQVKNANPIPINGHIIGSEPTDYPAFEASIAQMLASAPVSMIGVDNEEASLGMFSIPGDPTSGQRTDAQDELAAEAYGRYLAAVVAAAGDIDVTDGGLITDLIKYGAYQNLVDTGHLVEATAFASVCFDSFMSTNQARTQAVKCKRWLTRVALAKPTLINFHFYAAANKIPTGAIETCAAFVEGFTGLPAVCDELGVRDSNPATATACCQGAVNAGLSLATFYTKAASLAMPLVNIDGSLSVSGQAVAAFVNAA